jgi:hypothetical protein
MNRELTEQIAYHILASLGVLPATFINAEKISSLNEKQFILTETISFEEDSALHSIYGCQIITADNTELKILLADCTQAASIPEFCLIVQLKDSPAYGVYLIFNKLVAYDPPSSEAMIAVNMEKNWMPCDTYLQATFLAGMERIKDLGLGWGKCSSYQEQYKLLLSFIKFHDVFFDGEQ